MVNGEPLGVYIRKVPQPGIAWCVLCEKTLKYSSSGRKCLVDHCASDKHKSKVRLKKENYTVSASISVQNYGLHPMFKNVTPAETAKAEPLVPVSQRVRNMEAMILGFTAENSMGFSSVPRVIELAKELARDPKALDKLSMDRTSASYKLRFGLGKTVTDNVTEALRMNFFSLNLDESTSNNWQRVLAVLVSYFCPIAKQVVVHHLTAVSLVKVNAKSIYDQLVDYFAKRNIPWTNLMSIMMDSCNVMRGSKAGFETLIRTTVAPHLLDVDGDSCHHAHNIAKAFCQPFENFIEGLCTDIYNDFKWSVDLREHLEEICLIVGVKYTMPQRYVSHRWLSVLDVSQDLLRMLDAYTLFYYSFLKVQDRPTFYPRVADIFKKCSVNEVSKAKIQDIRSQLRAKNMTREGEMRKKRIVDKLFMKRKTMRLISNFYASVLPQFKSYVLLFQRKDPQIHKLHEEMLRLATEFLGLFIKPEFIPSSRKELTCLDVVNKDIHLPGDLIFYGQGVQKILDSSKKDDSQIVKFKATVKTAYQKGAQNLLKKMPLRNPLLKAISSIDPAVRSHSEVLKQLLKLPKLVTNVLQQHELEEYEAEVRRYCVDILLPKFDEEGEIRIDSWWSIVKDTKRYDLLCKMVLAILSCFHGPAVESSFNLMNDVIDSKSSRLSMDSYCAVQAVKYNLLAANKNAVDFFKKKDFLKESLDPVLYKNLVNARTAYEQEKIAKKQAKEEKERMLSASVVSRTTKRRALEIASLAAKKARLSHNVTKK